MSDYWLISFLSHFIDSLLIPVPDISIFGRMNLRGGSKGGGRPWGQEPPPPFWGTPKLHKEGKNVVRMRAKTPHFST